MTKFGAFKFEATNTIVNHLAEKCLFTSLRICEYYNNAINY